MAGHKPTVDYCVPLKIGSGPYARVIPVRIQKWQLCGAKTRRGTSCKCRALPNGRCKLHGGLSTGPRTEAGRKRSLAALSEHWGKSPGPTTAKGKARSLLNLRQNQHKRTFGQTLPPPPKPKLPR